MNVRKTTKEIQVGNLKIGGNSLISIQSMTKVSTRNINSVINEIKKLEEYGCDIVRIAIPDLETAELIPIIKQNIKIPLVADTHFDYQLAINCAKNGIDKIRINPGNTKNIERLKELVFVLKERKIPIRIGINAGSLDKSVIEKFDSASHAMVFESENFIKVFNDMDFDDICVSVKSSSVVETIKAYQLLSKRISHPLHIGITESGTKFSGTIKSSIGIGSLLLKGIGDTIRVSLTDESYNEVLVAKEILKSLDLRQFGVKIISCPTCGRTSVNLKKIVDQVEEQCQNVNVSLTVAIMGCSVNGPGEASGADIGIAAGNGKGVLFKKGKIIRTVNEEEMVSILILEIHEMARTFSEK